MHDGRQELMVLKSGSKQTKNDKRKHHRTADLITQTNIEQKFELFYEASQYIHDIIQIDRVRDYTVIH